MNDEIRMANSKRAFGSQASCLTGPTRFQRVAVSGRSINKMLVGRDRLEAFPPVL
jgi:hypothetical protein